MNTKSERLNENLRNALHRLMTEDDAVIVMGVV